MQATVLHCYALGSCGALKSFMKGVRILICTAVFSHCARQLSPKAFHLSDTEDGKCVLR